ncbi:hypothetical protein FHS43_006217 [Streptosporangium becharense]|uniref:Uncharacterized protein n=1 Tax=Streptosporangium becharense TaxID=1816182 RepID=A0A7W9IHR9_9ACTN|nr:hypothetical protein [Streptosporangium becharense]MBB2914905.1 hypothetical protein [Streptosporangium becharense]MBB5820284.1 hypothetical protein [Streptosporangium becharense]
MSDIYRMLSPEERAEYDALLHEAGYDDNGEQRPAHEIKERMHRLLQDAVQAHRTWAGYVLDADVREGHHRRFKGWDRARQVVSTRHGGRVVKRSAVMSLRRRDPDNGRTYWQGTFYPDMTREDLLDVINGSEVRIGSERITIATARRLVALLDETGAATVAEALEARGVELETYLLEESA